MFLRLLALAAGAAGCYSAPEPDCGFACGPNNACPADYACAADRHCHRNGTPDSLVCGTAPDGGTDTGAGPHVLTTEPANNTTGVAVLVAPTAVLDQMVVVFSTIDMSMTDAAGAPVAGLGEVSVDQMSLQYFPRFQLAANERYTVTIGAGVETTGGPLAPFSWSFTTGGDHSGPNIVGTVPTLGASGISPEIAVSVAFDEVVQGVDTTSFTVSDGVTAVPGTIATNDGYDYVFTPDAPLANLTTYTVELTPAIHDAAGNAMTDFSFVFTTF
jgi:hypothetical protein